MDTDTSAHSEVSAILHELARAISENDIDAVLAMFWSSEYVTMFGSEEQEVAFGPDALKRLWTRVLSRGHRYIWQWSDEMVVDLGPVTCLSATARVTLEDSDDSREIAYRATL